jgi:hypothetical protein
LRLQPVIGSLQEGERLPVLVGFIGFHRRDNSRPQRRDPTGEIGTRKRNRAGHHRDDCLECPSHLPPRSLFAPVRSNEARIEPGVAATRPPAVP